MHRHHRRAVVAVAGLLVLLGGCSSDPQPAAAPPPAEDPGVIWIDSLCGAMAELPEVVQNPQIDTSSPTATFRSYSAFAGTYIAAIDRAVQGAAQAGAAPLPGGEEMRAALVGPLTEYRARLDQARTTLDQADPNDPATVQAAAAAFEVLRNPPQFGDVTATPEVTAASSAAPRCQDFQRPTASPSAAPGGN